MVRTWSPRGVTPRLRAPLTREHVSLVGAVTPDGRLIIQQLTQPVDSETITVWLSLLQEVLPGKLWILWDGAPIHRSKLLKEYLAKGAGKRIHLERFPGYAPELNPAEGVWQYLKHVELRNLCCADMPTLIKEITAAVRRMQEKPEIVTACFRQVGYY